MREIWLPVEEAPGYRVSNHGRVRRDGPEDYDMATGRLPDGTRTVSLTVDHRQQVFVLRRVVAATFCDIPDEFCDTVIHLDGNQNDCKSDNLAWRPRWFAWRYTRQFRVPIPEKYNIPVINLSTDQRSPSVPAAGIVDGVLWADVYKSIVEGLQIYPFAHSYAYFE